MIMREKMGYVIIIGYSIPQPQQNDISKRIREERRRVITEKMKLKKGCLTALINDNFEVLEVG